MSAETLRRAAALMRERAEATVPGPWVLSKGVDVRGNGGRNFVATTTGAIKPEQADHIASWHPAVALAVADWLEVVSVDVDKRDNPKRVGGRYEALRIPDERAALAVARVYLGSES